MQLWEKKVRIELFRLMITSLSRNSEKNKSFFFSQLWLFDNCEKKSNISNNNTFFFRNCQFVYPKSDFITHNCKFISLNLETKVQNCRIGNHNCRFYFLFPDRKKLPPQLHYFKNIHESAKSTWFECLQFSTIRHIDTWLPTFTHQWCPTLDTSSWSQFEQHIYIAHWFGRCFYPNKQISAFVYGFGLV